MRVAEAPWPSRWAEYASGGAVATLGVSAACRLQKG